MPASQLGGVERQKKAPLKRGFRWGDIEKKIGAAGFEPTTPTTPKWCATKLRYAPAERSYHKACRPLFFRLIRRSRRWLSRSRESLL